MSPRNPAEEELATGIPRLLLDHYQLAAATLERLSGPAGDGRLVYRVTDVRGCAWVLRLRREPPRPRRTFTQREPLIDASVDA